MLPISHTLKKPVTHAGKTYDTITVDRVLNVGDMVIADGFTGDFTKTVALVSSLSGVPMQALKMVDALDFSSLVEKLAPLLGNSE